MMNDDLLARADAAPRDVVAVFEALNRERSIDAMTLIRVRRYATAFVDGLLATGAPRAAQAAAARAVVEGRELAAPPSRGAARLAGAEQLDCSSSPHRDLISAVLGALGRVAAVDRGVVPWLFEALKQWASRERQDALAALLGARPTAQELADGLGEALRFAERRKDAQEAGGLLRDLAGAGRADAAWTLALLDALERAPRAGERLLASLYGHEFGDVLLGEGPPWLAGLGAGLGWALARHLEGTTIAGRTLAVLLLGRVPEVDVRAAALALLAGGGWPAAHVVGLVIARGWVGEDVARALAEARGRPPPGPKNTRVEQLAEGLAALARTLAPREAPVSRVDGAWVIAGLPACAASPPVVDGARVWIAYHRVVRAVPASAWMNEEDAFGFLDMSLGACPEVRERPLPVAFPAARNGASGARRSLRLVAQLGEELVCAVHSPFAEGASWGSRNYLFGFDRGEGRWSARSPDPVALPAGAREAELRSVCFGELIAWEEDGTLRLVADGTPYFLDDYEVDPAVRRAKEAQRAAEARRAWGRSLVGSGPPLDAGPWRLTDGREVVGAHARLVEAWPAAATGRLFLRSGVALADGRVALIVGRRARDEPERDALVIAPTTGPR